MQIEVIAIGEELLRGSTINTNAPFLSRHLFQHGFAVTRHTTLPDDPLTLKQGLKEALGRSRLVITTGGLGPTCDDCTRAIAAELFSSDLYFNETLAAELKKRYGQGLESLEDQATVPRKAQLLPNPIGTASGLVFTTPEHTLILLPGVPAEMEQMTVGELTPYLVQAFPEARKHAYAQICLCHLYESLVDPTLRTLKQRYPTVEVGIYPAYGFLTVTLTSTHTEHVEAFRTELHRKFPSYVFPSQSGKIEEALQAWFVQNKKSLALAESCTGGLMAAHLTALPGASDYFLGSIVAYSNAMKKELLGVSEQTLQNTGAVSSETAREMLEGLFARSQADFGIAVTGIAGPSGGSTQKPVGTMWAAIGERGKPPNIGSFFTKGNRHTRILSTTNHLLCALWRTATQGCPPFPFF